MDKLQQDRAKAAAAQAALSYVQDGMRLGLGTGSTSACFVSLLGARVRDGLSVRAVPTSEEVADLARREGIELVELDALGLDLAVDGADEFDSDLCLIKGGGGALLREKIVARAARHFVVLADTSKQVDRLGAFALPVEIIAFGAKATMALILLEARRAGIAMPEGKLRLDASGVPVSTDSGNLIYDLSCGVIEDPASLAMALSVLPGVVEHGLFVGMSDELVLGNQHGEVETLRVSA